MIRAHVVLTFSLLLGSTLNCDTSSPAKGERAAAEDAAKESPPAADASPAAKADCDGPKAYANPVACGIDPKERPAWLSTDLIDHREVLQDTGAQLENGPMSWAVMVSIDPEKFTVDSCIAHLREKIQPYVPKLGDALPGKDGRKTVAGETAVHQIRFMCGMAPKSGLTAYIGLNSK